MKWINSIRRNSITFLICFILFLISVNGAFDFYHRSVIEKHENLIREVERAKKTMQNLLDNLKNADLGIRGYYIIPQKQLLDPYSQATVNFPRELKNVDSIVVRNGMNPKEFVPVKTAFLNYFDLLDKIVKWKDEGNTASIDSVVSLDPGYGVWAVYDAFNKKLVEKLEASLKASEIKTDRVTLMATIVKFSLLLFGIPTLVIVVFRLNRERKRRLALFADLDKNNRKFLFDPKEKEEVKIEEKTIINALLSNLRKASEFISHIANGNYEVKWDGLNEENKAANQENLVGELLKMRDQMVKVKQEDNVRMWVTEGISKFSEIVRQHQDDMETLSDKLTSNVAKYLNANQAFLYFVSDEDSHVVLELFGCYAYDRKRFLEKTVEPGQGLVGQTYLEKSINHLKKIPQNYVQITSGLGEATPSSLLIVPLKFNEQVEGVLEIASFYPFKQYEIDFLERIGEIIASAIVNIRGAVKMKKMMQTMQVQSEEMKSQEEEMRQNMEELQATQEEMSRKAKEYQSIIVEKEAVIEQKQNEVATLQKQIKQGSKEKK